MIERFQSFVTGITTCYKHIQRILSIKPVIGIEDGLVSQLGKARGSKQGNNLLRELISNCGGSIF